MSNYLSRLTVIVLALSLGAFSLGCSDEYPRYSNTEATKCDLTDAFADFLVTRSIMTEESSKKSMHVGWGFFQFQWVDAESRREAEEAKDEKSSEEESKES